MALDRLTDTTLSAVQLHSSLDLEGLGVGGVAGDADKDQPLLVRCDAVVDDLSSGERRMAVEDLYGSGRRVGDTPVKDGCISDEA